MKRSFTPHKVIATQSKDPAEILRLVEAAGKIDLSPKVYNLARDVFDTIAANAPQGGFDKATTAGFLMRLAFVLNGEARLELAPHKALH